MNPHVDTTFITIVFQTPSQNREKNLCIKVDGKWVDVPAVRNTVFVNFGEVMESRTNG